MVTTELWKRIEEFDLDHADALLTFTKRFARDHRMKLDKATRAIQEYKRFIYLVAISDRPLTPSHTVDLVWHLHMTYTDSYWNDLCRDILHQEVNHNPTKGRSADKQLYTNQYEYTLQFYRDTFGEEPPKDIWEAPYIRTRKRSVTVNTDEHWVLPKPTAPENKTLRYISSAVALMIGGILIPILDNALPFMLAIGYTFIVLTFPHIDTSRSSNRGSNDSGGCGGCGGCGDCGGCGGCG